MHNQRRKEWQIICFPLCFVYEETNSTYYHTKHRQEKQQQCEPRQRKKKKRTWTQKIEAKCLCANRADGNVCPPLNFISFGNDMLSLIVAGWDCWVGVCMCNVNVV